MYDSCKCKLLSYNVDARRQGTVYWAITVWTEAFLFENLDQAEA